MLPATTPTVIAAPADKEHQYFLAVEGQLALQLQNPKDIVGALLGAFFVFNMKYPDKLKPLFLAMESILLKKSSEKMSTGLKVVMNNLERI